MADEFKDYIFENKRETSNDFALANGEVTSVLRRIRYNTPFASFGKHPSYTWNGTSAKRLCSVAGGLAVLPQAKTVEREWNNPLSVSGLSFPGKDAKSVGMPVFSSAAGRNSSNGEDLDLKARETPVFSGLFAKHDQPGSSSHGNGKASVMPPDGFTLPTDASSIKTTVAGNGIDLSVLSHGDSEQDSSSAASSRRAVRRTLTVGADDMANCRTYQVGYDIEAGDSGMAAHSAAHNGTSYDGVSVSGKNSCYAPGQDAGFIRPVGGDVITIDDPEIGGWIGIPERPIGGWIGIPERPIGGWIIVDPVVPYPFDGYEFFEEYDIFEEYGIDLSSDWTEYTDSDFSKIDLAYSSKLSFTVSATNAATFTVYRCIQDANGGYTLKALQTTSLVLNAESGDYEATTKALLLEAGQYCLYVQSDDPVSSGDPAASYKFDLNREDSDIFVDGDNSDDWTDLGTEGESGEVADAGTLDESSFDVFSDWVGFGDEIDYAGFTLDSTAKLSFSINSTDAAKFTIYKLVQDRNGKYSLKALQTTSLSYDKEFEEYDANTKSLLLEAGEYYFSVQSTNAAQGGSAYYDIYVNEEDDATVFFTEGDNSDDWTDLKTEGAAGQVGDVGVIDGNSFDICTNWVGFGDEFDYAKFTLNSAASLSFTIDADGAAKFTIYKLVQDKNGKYSLKTLQTTKLSYDSDFEEYDANTKSLFLEAGEYYFSVQSTDAAQGGSAHYDIYLNQEEEDSTVFYTDGDNSDDWTDLETEGEYGAVAYAGLVDETRFDLLSDWVGFGDRIDYAGFTLDTAASLSFTVSADGAAKFTIYQLVQDKNGKYSLKTLQTTSLSYDKEFGEYDANTKSLFLAQGDYYISMQSTDAAKGGGAWYNIYINSDDSTFFTSGDDWSDLETLGPDGSVGDLGFVDEFSTELTTGQVGGKAADYAKITLFDAAKISFLLNADGAAKFAIYRLVQGKNGKYSLDTLQATSLTVNGQTGEYDAATKALLLEAGEYYISMQSADASRSVEYGISLNGDGSTFFTEGWNYDDWTDLKTAGELGEVGFVGTVNEYGGELLSDWVGFGDEIDYMGFTLDSAASLRFTLEATDAATFTIYSLTKTKSGKYKLNPILTTALSLNGSSGEYEAVTKALLLEAGDYYFSVQSTNAAQGGNAYYNVSVDPSDCVFYTQGNKCDDWTDLKTAGESGMVGYAGVIDENTMELVDDWVGFGDAIDYAGFTLFNAAKLSFSISAGDATTFTVYRLVQDKNGMYSLKTLQTAALAFNRQTGEYDAVTKGLLLEAGEYYFSVRSTNADRGGSAVYRIELNAGGSQFYTEGENYDDWTDLETAGMYGEVGNIGYVDKYSSELASGWVGFGDEVDYAGFSLFDDADLSFSVEADGAATFTVYSLTEARNGTFKLKTLQTTTLVFDKQSQKYVADTKALSLEADDYYFSIRSDDAGQGGGAHYKLSLNETSEFFPDDSAGDENWGAIEYEPEPICGGDTVLPVEWTWTCGYPACDAPEPVMAAGTPVDDVLAYTTNAAVAANGGSAGLAISELTENKQTDVLKELSSLA